MKRKQIGSSILVFLLLGIFSCSLLNHQARAAGDVPMGLAISPPTFELSGNPNDTLNNIIKVTNISSDPVEVSTSTRNFTAIGEEGAVGLTEEENSFSLARWIAVSPSTALIKPSQTQFFTFTTAIPQNAEPGGHFGSVVFSIGGNQPDQTGAAVSQEVASLILLRVAGKAKEQVTIENFFPFKKFYEYGPINFEIRVKNEGSIHAKPTGTITLTNFFGRKVGTFNIESKNVLPGATRKLTAYWNKKALFGKYTATLSVIYGSDNQILTATNTFVAIPYKIVGVVLLALLIIGIIIFKARKRLKLAARVLFSK
jgi:hypothetical protein